MNLTDAQTKGLHYFKAKHDGTQREFRQKGGRLPDPRVVEALLSKGLIVQTGWNYGALFSITDAGKAVLAQ